MWIALAIVLIVSFLLRLHHLGQPAVKDLDEVFHALVARSMMHNPLFPKLYEHPYLPFDPTNWLSNSIWLHKPPVAMWQMALSMTTLGESNFAMRIPSLLLSTAAVALTFLIGRSLGDVRAGLFASVLQALNPAITRFVHGQVFSDHVDIAMLFYSELAIWCLIHAAKRDTNRWAVLAGVATGLAYLSKSFPCLFIVGLAVVLLLAKRYFRYDNRLKLDGKQMTAFIWSAVAVALPWTLWCWSMFPREFAHEQAYVFQHLTQDIETFAAPWDRLLFEYLFRALLEWYPLAIAAMLFLLIDGWRARDSRRWFVIVWALGVIVPHLLAVSKTPSATLTAWPALWLAIGFVVADSTRGRAATLYAVVAAAMLIAFWPTFPINPPVPKDGYSFGRIMLAEWRVLVQFAVIALSALIALSRGAEVSPKVAWSLLAVALTWPVARHCRIAWLTSDDVDPQAVSFPILGKVVRDNAPSNAVFFVDDVARHEHLIAMWWLDRTCYPIRSGLFEKDVEMVVRNGGQPFILSRLGRSERPLFPPTSEGTIYSIGAPSTRPGE